MPGGATHTLAKINSSEALPHPRSPITIRPRARRAESPRRFGGNANSRVRICGDGAKNLRENLPHAHADSLATSNETRRLSRDERFRARPSTGCNSCRVASVAIQLMRQRYRSVGEDFRDEAHREKSIRRRSQVPLDGTHQHTEFTPRRI